MRAPRKQEVNGALRLIYEEEKVRLEFDAFMDSNRYTTADCTVVSIAVEKPRLLKNGRIALMDVNMRSLWVRNLQVAAPVVLWAELMESACYLAHEFYKTGENTIDLRNTQPRATRWLLYPYLEYGGPTTIYGPGGTGKTYSVIAKAMTIASGMNIIGKMKEKPGPVIALDWETDEFTWAERMRAVAHGAGLDELPPVHYRHMSTPLVAQKDSLRKEIKVAGYIAGFIDSLGAACGGDLVSSKEILACFAAIRELGIPFMVVSHVNMNNVVNPGEKMYPFGSVYTINASRNLWSLSAEGDQEDDTLPRNVLYKHEKTNNGRYQRRHAIVSTFVNEEDSDGEDRVVSVTYRREDNVLSIPTVSARAPLSERIHEVLQKGATHEELLAESLEEAPREIRQALASLLHQQRVLRLPDGRWGLAAQESFV